MKHVLAIIGSAVLCLAFAWFGVTLIAAIEKTPPAIIPPAPAAKFYEPSPPIPAHDETPGPGWVQVNKNTWVWRGQDQ